MIFERFDDEGPLIVGIGGSAAPGSSTEKALALALAEARAAGARTRLLGAKCISRLPYYLMPEAASSPEAADLVSMIRAADGLIIASPGYHGCLSGVVKNAIDYIEDTARDERPYLTDLPVGLIAIAGGGQAAMSTLMALRTIVHSLRGWPTPFGASITPVGPLFKEDRCVDEKAEGQIRLVGLQVVRCAQHAALVLAPA
ncbi:MAG: reductase [Ramlibacter sp.]|nr:reductase [Ramlibacter sp.]